MADSSIPVDLLNPGQVFACIGFAEVADVLLGNAEGCFDWSSRGDVRFRLRAQGAECPIGRGLTFLANATATGEAPAGSQNLGGWKEAWGTIHPLAPRLGYPFPDPESPATVVCVLSDGASRICIEHWGDKTRDNVKFWAGSGGYPGVALARDALSLLEGRLEAAIHDPFSVSAPQSSSFRLDWRRDYIPIDAGFSLNAHGDIEPVGFPLVELLGAIGLNHARPRRPDRRNKLEYVYGVAGGDTPGEELWLPLSLLRASLGGTKLPFPRRSFRMYLGWPGKEGQARSITMVNEETTDE